MINLMIDPGHNYAKIDTGTNGNGLREEIETWEVGYKLGLKLANSGYFHIKLTRPTLETSLGTTLTESINARINMAKSWGSDYFVSIHFNGVVNPTAHGVETLVRVYKGEGSLAQIVQNNLVKSTGMSDRGVKERTDLGVLKVNNSILVECGFLTNPGDADIDNNHQDKIVDGIYNGIIEYFVRKGDIMPTKTFNDIEGHFAENHIKSLLEKGIVNGDGDGNFRPNDTATRGEVAVMIANAIAYLT